jgi:HemK-related putative methylase
MTTQSLSIAPVGSPRRYRRIRAALAKLLYWRFLLLDRHRYDNLVLEEVQGLPFVITPGVLNPKLMLTGDFFATQLNAHVIPPASEVLDMGTGSGVCAVVAARWARAVVAVDINPAAVRCAQINALLNKVEERVSVMQGDLFEPLAGRRFDVVLFNPPFLRGSPQNGLDYAWRSIDVPERFARDLREHLRPGGYALVLLSTYGGSLSFAELFERSGYRVSEVAARDYLNETLKIFKVY